MALDEIIKLSDGSFLDKEVLLAGQSAWSEYEVSHQKDGMLDLGSMRLYRRVTVWGTEEDGTKIRAWGIWDVTEMSDEQVKKLQDTGLFLAKSEE